MIEFDPNKPENKRDQDFDNFLRNMPNDILAQGMNVHGNDGPLAAYPHRGTPNNAKAVVDPDAYLGITHDCRNQGPVTAAAIRNAENIHRRCQHRYYDQP